jgi:hypothetical protein
MGLSNHTLDGIMDVVSLLFFDWSGNGNVTSQRLDGMGCKDLLFVVGHLVI